MPPTPKAPAAPPKDVPVNADLAWSNLMKTLANRIPRHLAGTAASRKRLNATRRRG